MNNNAQSWQEDTVVHFIHILRPLFSLSAFTVINSWLAYDISWHRGVCSKYFRWEPSYPHGACSLPSAPGDWKTTADWAALGWKSTPSLGLETANVRNSGCLWHAEAGFLFQFLHEEDKQGTNRSPQTLLTWTDSQAGGYVFQYQTTLLQIPQTLQAWGEA